MKIPRTRTIVACLAAALFSAACCLPTIFFGVHWWVHHPRLLAATFDLSGDVKNLAFSADSKLLIVTSASHDNWQLFRNDIHVFDVATREEIHVEPVVGLAIVSMRLSPDGTRLLTTAHGGTKEKRIAVLTVFEFPSFKLVHQMEVGQAAPCAIFSPDGNLIAVQRADAPGYDDPSELWIIDGTTFEKRGATPKLYLLSAFEFTPDSRSLIGSYYLCDAPPLCTRQNRGLGVFTVPTGERRKEFLVHAGMPGVNEYLPEQGKFVYHLNPSYPGNSTGGRRLSPDGHYRFSVEKFGHPTRNPRFSLSLQDIRNERVLSIYGETQGKALSWAFSPDGKFLAVGTSATREVPGDRPPTPWTGKALMFSLPD